MPEEILERRLPKLLIVINEQGGVNVSGDIDKKLLCYGMLEEAKDAIRQWHEDRKKGPQIAIPSPVLSDRLTRNGESP